MMRRLLSLVSLVVVVSNPLAAQTLGTASGNGIMEVMVVNLDPDVWNESEKVPFLPRFAFAYEAPAVPGPGTSTWLVLTEKEPPIVAWMATQDRAEARREWCEREKASFVAVEINAAGDMELYYLCPGNGTGNVYVEMLSVSNGLKSVELTFSVRDATRLKGTLRGGDGSCGEMVYCEQTEDYTFDAPLLR